MEPERSRIPFPKVRSAAEKSAILSGLSEYSRLPGNEPMNPGKGMEVLGKALAEARKGGSPAQEPIILTILQTRRWEPENRRS
jgi:hypothetical protein